MTVMNFCRGWNSKIIVSDTERLRWKKIVVKNLINFPVMKYTKILRPSLTRRRAVKRRKKKFLKKQRDVIKIVILRNDLP